MSLTKKPYNKEWAKNYRNANRQKIRANYKKHFEANREKILARRAQWLKDNPEKMRGYKKKRNSIIESTAHLGWVDIRLIDNYYTKICGICELSIESKFEVDHIIPLTRGGVHTLENLQLSHPVCNRVKHNSLQSEMALDIVLLKQQHSSKIN